MIGAYLKKNLEDKTFKQSLQVNVDCQRKQFTVSGQCLVTLRRFGTATENWGWNVHFDFCYLENLEQEQHFLYSFKLKLIVSEPIFSVKEKSSELSQLKHHYPCTKENLLSKHTIDMLKNVHNCPWLSGTYTVLHCKLSDPIVSWERSRLN